MRTCAHHPTIDAGIEAGAGAVLLRQARTLAEAAADDGCGTRLVALTGPLPEPGTEPLDLAVRPLDGHPVDVLVGFVAPAAWSAVGVVAPATAHRLTDVGATAHPVAANGAIGAPALPVAADADIGADACTGASPPFDDGERIVMVHLVAREGARASVGRRADGSVWVWATSGTAGDDEPTGRLDDVLRRVLGLPTRPPPADPAELWASWWLDRLLTEVGLRPDRSWSWANLAVLHPAAQLVVDDRRGRVTEVVRAMPRLAEILARGRTWGDLRRDAGSGGWATPSIPPDVARWMDDGIFSRWLLDEVPSCGETLVALRDLLPHRLVRRLEDTVAGWQVSTSADADPWTTGPPSERST